MFVCIDGMFARKNMNGLLALSKMGLHKLEMVVMTAVAMIEEGELVALVSENVLH